MKTFIVAAVALTALVTAAAGQSAPKSSLCVGGPHCYATVQAAVNAAADGVVIRINPGKFAGGVTILNDVTLVGVDAHASKIWGGGPVVTIGSATNMPTVTLKDLTIGGGDTTTNVHAPNCGVDVPVCGPGYADSTAIGGGIVAFAGTNVTISHSIVTGNTATPSETTQSVKATCATGPCVAAFGDAAGIDIGGTMTLLDSVVSNNHASAPAQSNGGGIVIEDGGSLSLQDSQVTGNSAEASGPTGRFVSGGGVFVAGGGTLIADHSSIDGNSARLASSLATPYPEQDGGTDQSNAQGGGVFLSDGSTATISNSTLNGNSVSVNTPDNQSFGADAAFCACGGVTLSVSNTQVQHNSLSVIASASNNGPSGPGIFEADGDNDTLSNVRIDWNNATITTAGDSAGMVGTAAFFPGDPVPTTIANSSISHNTVTANAPNGDATIVGAGLVVNGDVEVRGSAIVGNHGVATGQTGLAQGGGIWSGALFGPPFSTLLLQGSSVTGNVLGGSPGVALSGGGIWNQGGSDFTVTLQGSVVAHNTPDDCVGC